MSIAIPRWLVPWLFGAGLVGTVLALLVVIRAYVQLRRGEYYVIREEARHTGLRASLIALILALLSIGVLLLPRQEPAAQPTPVPPTPTTQPSPTPTQAPPAATATATSTPRPTATEPFIPTSTPQATLPVTFTVPLSAAVPPPADARLEFWTLAEGVTENSRPLEPDTQFPQGIQRIYLFFRYDGLLPNVPLTTVWYINGKLLSGWTDLWPSQRSSGEWYVFLNLEAGYPVGEYEVQVWLGSRLQIRTLFSVIEDEG